MLGYTVEERLGRLQRKVAVLEIQLREIEAAQQNAAAEYAAEGPNIARSCWPCRARLETMKMFAAVHRECVECCGVRYTRVRVKMLGAARARRWSATAPVACVECGARLPWPALHRPVDRARFYREREQEKMVLNLLRGLTTKGTPRVRQFLSREEDQQRRLERYHRRAAARMAQGLTSRGTVRKRRPNGPKMSEVESAWKELRATMTLRSMEMEAA